MKQAYALLAVATAPLLSACAAADGDYPSLAIRDSERFVGQMAGAAPQPYIPAPLEGGTLEQIAQLERRALDADGDFSADEAVARRRAAAARGSGPGSEAWAQAQVAIAVLEGHRGELIIALADLDRIYVDTSSDGQAIAEVEEAREGIDGLLTRQNAVIAELLAMVRS